MYGIQQFQSLQDLDTIIELGQDRQLWKYYVMAFSKLHKLTDLLISYYKIIYCVVYNVMTEDCRNL